jgi:arylsulfatase A-like enzyme/Flp pilus assembly protein TadD
LGKAEPVRAAGVGGTGAVLLGIVAVLALILSSCSPAAKAPPPNVILITVDTLRADRLGCYGNTQIETPNMDAMARDGVLFARAIAQVPLTAPSHAAILTGTYPIWNGMRDWSDPGLRPDVPTLAEIFKRQGYTTAAFVSAFVLDSMWGLARGFDHYDDWFEAQDYTQVKRQSVERSADKTVDRTLAWLRSRPPGPFFLWVHLYDPHAPYRPPEPFKARYQGRPYDGEVAYTDQQLGRLMQFLRAQGLYSSALIVLTSDHGEALGEHQEQEHGYFIYQPGVHVPLVMKFPAGFAPAQPRISKVVNTIDLAPTVAQFCAFPSDEQRSFQGRSLLTLVTKGSDATPRYGYSESLYPRSLVGASPLFGLQTERYHYIRAPHEELYDLDQDPQEKRNVLRENPNVAAALREQLQGTLSRYKPAEGSGAGGRVDPETAEKLRSLGYVSLSVAKPPGDFDPNAPDAKELIGTYNEIMRTIELADRGAYHEANARLAALAGKHPKIYLVPFLEGENLRALGDARGAIVQYRRALAINPLFDQAAMGLGHAAYMAEMNSEAVKAFDLALQLNPQNFPVRLARARVYWRLGRLDEAAAEQLKVLDDHPNLAQAYADYGITLVRLKRYEEALPALTKGVDLGYRDGEVYNFMANAYGAQGRVDEAIRSYEQAISLDPKYPTPYVNLALIYNERGQRDKSREYFQKACRLSPELCRQLAAKLR